jgi:hypothetical protein
MEKTIKDEYGYLYRGIVMETLQEAEDVRYIVEKFKNYPQKMKLTSKIYETLNLLKVFGITDIDLIYKTIKENKDNLWNIF